VSEAVAPVAASVESEPAQVVVEVAQPVEPVVVDAPTAATEVTPAVVETAVEVAAPAAGEPATPATEEVSAETVATPAVETPASLAPGELIERAVNRVEPQAVVAAPAPSVAEPSVPVALPEGMVLVETRSKPASAPPAEEAPIRRGRPRPATANAPVEAEPMRQVETRN
jgi:hypothetical protein